MAKYTNIGRDIQRACVGSMRYRIVLQTADLTPSSGSSVDVTETFVDIATVWANIQMPYPYADWNQVAVPGDGVFKSTHDFIIRHRTDVVANDVVVWDGNYYHILQVEIYEPEKRFIRLKTAKGGSTSKTASQVFQD